MSTSVQGAVASGYEGVADVFAANFVAPGEVGAALAVMVDGVMVADLWGGYRDSEQTLPWQQDTMANIWSTTKGVTALCFAMIADRGLIDYDRPVADYWPEFAVNGKSAITVGMLLSHQAGITGFVGPAVAEDYFDFEAAADRLAAQAPLFPPGSTSGYHAISIGPLANGLFRRVTGHSLGAFVADEFAGQRGLEIAIGLPAEWTGRGAEMIAPPELSSTASTGMPAELSPAQFAALANPPVDPNAPNSAGWRAAEIPSANGFATARALASLYGALAFDRVCAGRLLLGAPALAAATRERIVGMDAVLPIPARWGAGFLLNNDDLYGPSSAAFGHSGWGGSFAMGDPATGVGIGYVMNRMGTDIVGDPRDQAIIAAVYAASPVSTRLRT
ncbi:MAG: serine hydrolase domain-containing protein [Sphingomonas sp.]